MIYNDFISVFKKQLYIVSSEQFIGNTGDGRRIERYVAKHPKLKPQFLVKDGEVQGFKKTSETLKSLEDFSIFLEVHVIELEEEWGIESVDLYSEVSLNIQPRLKDMIYLSKLFEQSIEVERIIQLSNVTEETIGIHSKIDDIFMNIDEEMELLFSDKHILTQKIRFMLSEFCIFISCVHDMILKKKSLEKILQEIQNGNADKNSPRENTLL